MMRTCLVGLCVVLCCAGAFGAEKAAAPVRKPVAPAKPPPPPPPPPRPEQEADVSGVKITGHIEGENITFVLELTAKMRERGRILELVSGDIALEKIEGVEGRYRVIYDKDTYSLWLARSGEQRIKMTFASRSKKIQKGEWRECAFTVPLSNMRELQVTSDRPDLDIVFPNAMRVTREVTEKTLTTTAILGVGRGFAVRWKPQVQKLAGKLVAAADVNTIAAVSAGALRLDAIVAYSISQGEAREFEVALPKTLSVTQVRGPYIQDWNIKATGEKQTLTVTLTQPQKQQYAVQIQGEAALAEFPTDFELPVVEPLGTIRASGHACVGSDSAVHLKIKKAAGLTQIDANAFPRIAMDRRSPRPLPARSTFYYRYAATPYGLELTASDIKPSLDATQNVVVSVRDDDLVLVSDVNLDVRDAPVRELSMKVPLGFTVAEVTGNAVVPNGHEVHGTGQDQTVRIPFKGSVIGPTLIRVRLEIGGSPLGRAQAISGLDVIGAKSERGYVVLAAGEGIQIDVKKTDKLSDVHTGSVPMRVARAQMAYRFREPGWSLELRATQNPVSIRCELFHLASIGEGIMYESTTATLFVTGAPIDKFHFRVPERLRNIEFIGREVQSQKQDESDKSVWTVTLRRRILHDYTLLITSSQRYEPSGGAVIVGGIECLDADTQVGYMAVTSALNLKLEEKDLSGGNLLTIDRDELPASYNDRVLAMAVNTPVLRSYKYVRAPHAAELMVRPYETGSLLGVVIDRMELHTTISKEGEAVTTATYKVKNANQQFLQLKLPEGARVWSAEIIDEVNGNPVRRRVIASRDDKDNLLIPLERRPDPDSPITLVVTYGETGREKLGLGREYVLSAAQPQVPSTSARWLLTIPEKFAFASVESNMASETPPARQPGLGAIGAGIAGYYGEVIADISALWAGACAAVAAAAIGALAVFRRRWVGLGASLLIAVAWLALGLRVVALTAPGFVTEMGKAPTPPELTFSQALDLSKSPVEIRAHIVPWWAAGLLTFRTIAAVVVSLALLVFAAFKPRRRGVLIALAVGGLLCAAGAVAAVRPPLLIALLWVLPFVPLAFVILRWSVPARAPAAVLALLAAMLLPTGCASMDMPPPANGVVMDRTEFFLKAEDDSMEVTQHLVFRADVGAEVPILWGPAALVGVPGRSAGVDVRMTQTGCTLHVEEGGEHDITVKFLLPLAKAAADQPRRFSLAVPKSVIGVARLTIPGVNLDVTSPSAVKLEKREEGEHTVVDALLGPKDKLAFEWKPRARQTRLEKTVFFSNVLSSVRFRPGVVECVHAIHFRIAQGELNNVKIKVPEGMAVTAVDGRDLGTWRYDPATRLAEARLAKPAVGEYLLLLVTQVTQQDLPYTVTIGMPEVEDSAGERGAIGLYPASDVQIEIGEHPPDMNTEDFAREAGGLSGGGGRALATPRYAYRYQRPGAAVRAVVTRVVPEIRSFENYAFSIADDRLVYNGVTTVSITKAGKFSIDVRIPAGYDIDDLSSPDVSHWDEEKKGDANVVTVHFRRQLKGQAQIHITLGKNITKLADTIAVPRIEVVGSLKHTGQVVVSPDPGVRLWVKERSGVSHVKSDVTAGKDALVFKLLKQDWRLVLATEKIRPRLEVQFLHVANVSEGLVRGTTILKYTIHNAGVKVLRIKAPDGLTGLRIDGSNITKTHEPEEGSGIWQVELASKVDRYVMAVRYERRFDAAAGAVQIRPVRDLDADLQRGHIVVRTHQKVEVEPVDVELPLKRADARGIPRDLGAPDLFDAALCYHTSSADAVLTVKASRYDAADILPAMVSRVGITTVVSEEGHHISRVTMALRVGNKRRLRVVLPPSAELWSLKVNDRPTAPSLGSEPSGKELVVFIPLGPGAAAGVGAEKGSGETVLDFIYVTPRPPEWRVRSQRYEGPRFDLPLRNVRWTFYLPESAEYSDFDGTLEPDEETIRNRKLVRYDAAEDRDRAQKARQRKAAVAKQLLREGCQLSDTGRPFEAKQLFQSAYDNSLSDRGINEDARVRLRKLQTEQIMVGLAKRRGNVRPRPGRGLLEPADEREGRANFTRHATEREIGSLDQADSDSLRGIADRMIGQQEAAEKFSTALKIDMAPRGRVIAFERDLQVERDVDMYVSFAATTPLIRRNVVDYGWALGVALIALLMITFARRRSRPEPPVEPSRASDMTGPSAIDTGDIDEMPASPAEE